MSRRRERPLPGEERDEMMRVAHIEWSRIAGQTSAKRWPADGQRSTLAMAMLVLMAPAMALHAQGAAAGAVTADAKVPEMKTAAANSTPATATPVRLRGVRAALFRDSGRPG